MPDSLSLGLFRELTGVTGYLWSDSRSSRPHLPHSVRELRIRGTRAGTKKIPPECHIQRTNSSCLRKPLKGDDDDTKIEPLHCQPRSNATVDRPRKNHSKRWSGTAAEGTCHDADLADQRLRLLHPLPHI